MKKPAVAALALSTLVTLATLGGCASPAGQPAGQPPGEPRFALVEADIAGMHAAMLRHGLSCRQVVQGYLDRIAAYDRQGPALRSVVSLNPAALTEADRLDRAFKTSGLQGPLHCVTVFVKDNLDTYDMPTSAGAKAFEHNRPPTDAYVVGRLRAAGAILLAKANMDEFAFTYKGSSSVAGQTRNPYDVDITPGGSSSGSASGVAASLAMVGLGTDTGGSGRVPAAVQGLVGIRPSLRLLSQNGIVPLAHSEDSAAPICRTVQDCALLLQVMTGYDAEPGSGQRSAIDAGAPQLADAAAYAKLIQAGRGTRDITAALDPGALRGARIGVLRQLFPPSSSSEREQFNAVLEAAMQRMRAAGAVVEDVRLPDLDGILASFKTVKPYEFRGDLERYLQRWPSSADGHPRSYDALLAGRLFERRNDGPLAEYGKLGAAPLAHADYVVNITERFPRVRASLTRALDHLDDSGKPAGPRYDVLLYPTRANLNLDQDGKASNNPQTSRLSAWSGYPAMSIPAGMATMAMPRTTQPVGLELLAREFDEAALIRIGYAWQQLAQPRRAPLLTPELR